MPVAAPTKPLPNSSSTSLVKREKRRGDKGQPCFTPLKGTVELPAPFPKLMWGVVFTACVVFLFPFFQAIAMTGAPKPTSTQPKEKREFPTDDAAAPARHSQHYEPILGIQERITVS